MLVTFSTRLENVQEIFQRIVEAFENLDDISSHSFPKRVSILETVAKVRSCVVMLDLECDSLILEMFRYFLNTIRWWSYFHFFFFAIISWSLQQLAISNLLFLSYAFGPLTMLSWAHRSVGAWCFWGESRLLFMCQKPVILHGFLLLFHLIKGSWDKGSFSF